MWDDDDNNTPLVKQLRDQIDERNKRLKDLDATIAEQKKELDSLRPQLRLTTVKDLLADLKVNPKVAKLIPAEVEPTKEAISGWLGEYGDVLGVKQETEQAAPETPEVTGKPVDGVPAVAPDLAAQWERMQSQDSAAGATTPDKEAKDLAQLTAAYKAALDGGGSDAFFAMLNGERPIP
jgi:hypothetical protein